MLKTSDFKAILRAATMHEILIIMSHWEQGAFYRTGAPLFQACKNAGLFTEYRAARTTFYTLNQRGTDVRTQLMAWDARRIYRRHVPHTTDTALDDRRSEMENSRYGGCL